MDKSKKAFAINTLRRGTYRWHTRWAAEKRSKVGRGEYFCECCGVVMKKKDTQMDHVLPVVDPIVGFNGFDELIDRMFPSDEFGWQRLCRFCHNSKSKMENEIRVEVKQNAKKNSINEG